MRRPSGSVIVAVVELPNWMSSAPALSLVRVAGRRAACAKDFMWFFIVAAGYQPPPCRPRGAMVPCRPMKPPRLLAAVVLAGCALAAAAQQGRPKDYDDDPVEYRDKQDTRDAYRRGYERGYDRGFQRGLEEGRRAGPAYAAPPPPAAVAPPPVILGPIKITSAFYGSSSKNCDATRYVARQADGTKQHTVNVSNQMCGDPHHGQRKTLEVTYWCGAVSKSASAREHQSVYLNCHTP